MKQMKKIIGISCLLVMLTACGNSTAETITKINEIDQVNTLGESEDKDELRSPENKGNANEVESMQDDDVIEVTEKMYVTYINDMYTNAENYTGKKIRLEGMFTSSYDESTKETYYFVYRVGPGCCGNDGAMCGLEFTTMDEIPQEKDWIEVTGTLEEYEQNGVRYLTLRDSKVIIKTERGKEEVYQ